MASPCGSALRGVRCELSAVGAGDRDRRRAGRRPHPRHYSPRYQTGKHFCHQARPRQDSGFRSGEAHRGGRSQHQRQHFRRRHAVAGRPDSSGIRAGNHALHVAGAGAWAGLWIRARICSLSGSCSTRWRRECCPSRDRLQPRFSTRSFTACPEWPLRFDPATPPELERIVRKALEKDPAQRYPARRRCGPICRTCAGKWSQGQDVGGRIGRRSRRRIRKRESVLSLLRRDHALKPQPRVGIAAKVAMALCALAALRGNHSVPAERRSLRRR